MTMRAKRKASRADEYLQGVPNRDLDEDEYQALDADQRKAVRECGLWDVKTDAEVAGRADKPSAPAAAPGAGSQPAGGG